MLVLSRASVLVAAAMAGAVGGCLAGWNGAFYGAVIGGATAGYCVWRLGLTPVDPSRLSERSQRSYLADDVYEDEPYLCVACRASVVYTAAEQKRDFEERKKEIWTKRKRCEPCQGEWVERRREIAGFPERLRGRPDTAELRAMLRSMDRYWTLNDRKFDTALCNRIINRLAAELREDRTAVIAMIEDPSLRSALQRAAGESF